VAITRMTMEEIRARAASRTPEEEAEFRRRMEATTEEDIRRHMIEDGEDPDEATPHLEAVVLPQDVRKKLRMTQADFAALLRVPIGTLRNWEQNRFVMEPAAQTLLKLIDREPEAALRALRQPHAA
jgi:putative transcriptional regulator